MNQVAVYFRALLVIVACCTPASAQFSHERLRELLMVNWQEVIDASPTRGKEREELGRLADWARRAAEPLSGKRPAPPALLDAEGTERRSWRTNRWRRCSPRRCRRATG